MLTRPRRIDDPARRHGYALAVALILLISTALRLWQLGTPAEMMFDEIYYAKDAKAIVDGRIGTEGQYRWAAGDEVSWPHPEMGKFAISAGILLFGDRSFGWRLPAVIAGVGVLICVYPLARRLGLSPPWALLALMLAAADPLGIAQSRIATLDVFIAFWTVLCVLLTLRYVEEGWRPSWLFAAGAAGGMALATKWSGALALLAAALIIAASWLLQRRHARRRKTEEGDQPSADAVVAGPPLTPPHAEAIAPAAPQGSAGVRVLAVLVALILVPTGFYLLSYAPYFIAGHTLADFGELHRQMLTFNVNLDATHSYASLAPTWIVDYRPVWYYFEGTETYYGVIAIGNPFLWWLASASLVAAAALAVLRRSYALLPAAALVVVLYVPWFFTTRTSFLYYMTPVAPLDGRARRRRALPVRRRRRAASRLARGRRRCLRGRRPLAACRHRRCLALLGVAPSRQRSTPLAQPDRRRGAEPGAARPPALAAHAPPPPADRDGRRRPHDRHRGGVHPHRARASHLSPVLRAHHVVPQLDLIARQERDQAMTAAMIAFCACSRFSAWSKTTECGE